MVHLCRALTMNGACSMGTCLGESVSEWGMNVKAQDITVHCCKLYNHCTPAPPQSLKF